MTVNRDIKEVFFRVLLTPFPFFLIKRGGNIKREISDVQICTYLSSVSKKTDAENKIYIYKFVLRSHLILTFHLSILMVEDREFLV